MSTTKLRKYLIVSVGLVIAIILLVLVLHKSTVIDLGIIPKQLIQHSNNKMVKIVNHDERVFVALKPLNKILLIADNKVSDYYSVQANGLIDFDVDVEGVMHLAFNQGTDVIIQQIRDGVLNSEITLDSSYFAELTANPDFTLAIEGTKLAFGRVQFDLLNYESSLFRMKSLLEEEAAGKDVKSQLNSFLAKGSYIAKGFCYQSDFNANNNSTEIIIIGCEEGNEVIKGSIHNKDLNSFVQINLNSALWDISVQDLGAESFYFIATREDVDKIIKLCGNLSKTQNLILSNCSEVLAIRKPAGNLVYLINNGDNYHLVESLQ